MVQKHNGCMAGGSRSMARAQRGFTLIELVIVIILLGILAATGLPRMLDLTDDAEIASLEGMAGGFTAGLAMAHAQWAGKGNSRGQAVTPADKTAIDLEGKILYMNENGWPANTDPSADASEDSQTAAECQQIWNALLQNPPSTTTNENNRADARYFISVRDNNPDICRYEMILKNDPNAPQTHYFEYALDDGQITVFKPKQS